MAVLLHPIEPMIKMKLLLTVIISLARVFLKSLIASQKTDIIITPDAILNTFSENVSQKLPCPS